MILRTYQLEVIEKVRNSIRNGNKSIIIQATCGSGKTIIAGSIISSALEKGKKVLFLVHFRQLAYQAMERFEDFGISDEVGIIMAGEESNLDRPVQIASIQTYARRIEFDAAGYNRWFSDADIVFYDECHASIAKTRKELLDIYKGEAIIIGLSATPCRSDSRPLGTIYDDIVSCIGIKELTELEHLVPARYFGAKHLPDLSNIPTVAGDYNKKILGERVNKPELVGDILENWLRIAGDRQTVIFATNVKHSKYIESVFLENGISIEHVDAHTPPEEREDVLRRFKDGDTQIVTNVGVFSEGADFPWASSVVLARPSKSYGRFIQMAGRGLRLHPGKADCILIDHAGLIERHGFLDEPVGWTLEGKEKAWIKPERKASDPRVFKCRVCHQIFKDIKICPVCGTALKSFGKKIETTDDNLVELKAKRKTNRDMTFIDKRRIMGMLVYMQNDKGWNPGRKKHLYREIFSVWPKNLKGVAAIKPEGELSNMVKYAIIKSAAKYKKMKSQRIGAN